MRIRYEFQACCLLPQKKLSRYLFCYEGQSSSVLGGRIVTKGKVHFLREVKNQVSVNDDQYLPGDSVTKVKQINSQSDLISMASFAGPS